MTVPTNLKCKSDVPPGSPPWKYRITYGAPRKFNNAEELGDACNKYFEWVEDHPLHEEQLFHYQGEVVRATKMKMRGMTIGGLCTFLDINNDTWYYWAANREDLCDVIKRVARIIREQKVEGAMAGLLDPNIVSRLLGLADSTKQEISGPKGGAIEIKPSDKLTGIMDAIVKRRGKTS